MTHQLAYQLRKNATLPFSQLFRNRFLLPHASCDMALAHRMGFSEAIGLLQSPWLWHFVFMVVALSRSPPAHLLCGSGDCEMLQEQALPLRAKAAACGNPLVLAISPGRDSAPMILVSECRAIPEARWSLGSRLPGDTVPWHDWDASDIRIAGGGSGARPCQNTPSPSRSQESPALSPKLWP